MCRSKRAYYAPFARELLREDIVYQPLIWSCYGREHPEASESLRLLAGGAARRLGFASAAPLLARARSVLGVQVWRRAACMVQACLVQPSADEVAAALARSGDG